MFLSERTLSFMSLWPKFIHSTVASCGKNDRYKLYSGWPHIHLKIGSSITKEVDTGGQLLFYYELGVIIK